MTNVQNAPYADIVPKGNGRAFTYSDEPLVRMRNTCILPGNDSLEDMISSVDNGYYLLSTNNGQADSTSEFMFGITMGYEIKNGKLGKAIKDTTVSGVAFDLLKTVDMVGKDVSWVASGYCGKKTPLATAMGGPALKCRIQIGGR
jgi:TldD protein